MTRKIALIAGLFVFIFMPMQAARKLTKISFDKLTYDFGTIYEKDGNATCTFRFVNEGKTPLVILRAQASCGCTVPSYPEYPIAPGDTAEMKVEYRTRHRPGEFSKYIFVYSNTKPDRTTLQIKGVGIPDNGGNSTEPSTRNYRSGELRTRTVSE